MDWAKTVQVSSGRLDKLVNLAGRLFEASRPGTEDVEKAGLYAEVLRTLAGLETFPFLFLQSEAEAISESASKRLGKKSQVVFEDAALEIPLSFRETLSTSLIHAIRNSLSHGIESPQKRLKAGKPEVGTLRVRPHICGGELEVRVSDDGAGPDLETVVERAVLKGQFPAEFAERLTQEQKLEFLFHAGLSAAESVNDISGRGVGLDAVAKAWEGIGGSAVAEMPSEGGLTLVLRAPLAQFGLEARKVEIGEGCYWIPVADIESIADAKSLTATAAFSEALQAGSDLGKKTLTVRAGTELLAIPCRAVGEPEFRSFRRLDPSWSEGGRGWVGAWATRFPRAFASANVDSIGLFAPADAWFSLTSRSV